MNTVPLPAFPVLSELATLSSTTMAEYHVNQLMLQYPRQPGESDASYFTYLLSKLPTY